MILYSIQAVEFFFEGGGGLNCHVVEFTGWQKIQTLQIVML